MKMYYIGPPWRNGGPKFMQIVTVVNTLHCSTCGADFAALEEFPLQEPQSLIKEARAACTCSNILDPTGFSFTRTKNLMPIDDKETKEAFERLNQKDKIKEKEKVK